MLDNPSIETANNQQLLYYNNDSISKVLIYWNNGIWCYSNGTEIICQLISIFICFIIIMIFMCCKNKSLDIDLFFFLCKEYFILIKLCTTISSYYYYYFLCESCCCLLSSRFYLFIYVRGTIIFVHNKVICNIS